MNLYFSNFYEIENERKYFSHNTKLTLKVYFNIIVLANYIGVVRVLFKKVCGSSW